MAPVAPDPFGLALTDTPAQPPGEPLPTGEAEASCPYIKAGLNIEPTAASEPNFADIEGSRVQRVTVLSTLKPIGCRFFFRDYHPTGDILPSTYSSPTEAHNAMVVTAEAGAAAIGVPSFVPRVDGISFRTRLNASDAGQDWAFVFAKGNVMVVVRTDQTDTSANAKLIAEAIVEEF